MLSFELRKATLMVVSALEKLLVVFIILPDEAKYKETENSRDEAAENRSDARNQCKYFETFLRHFFLLSISCAFITSST